MVRAVVIGCGRMGVLPRPAGSFPPGWLPLSHAESVREAGFDLVALCDVSPDRLAKATQTYGVPGYADFRKMLAEVRPDLVTIATRTPEKRQIVEACKDVPFLYIEKPLANTLADCRHMLTRSLAYGVNRRYHATYRQAREMMSDVREVVFEFGRAALLWTHPHCMDLALFFLGTQVEDVQAVLDMPDADGDPIVEYARIRFAGGRAAVITRGDGCNVRLHGQDRTLDIHADGSWLRMSSGRGYLLAEETITPPASDGATVTALRELVAGIVIPPDEIMLGMKLLFACVWSHMQGNQPVRLDDVPDNLRVLGKGPFGYA
jgi:predicted dehydrogenase